MNESAPRRIKRIKSERQSQAARADTASVQQNALARQRFLGNIATLKASAIPSVGIEVLKTASLWTRLRQDSFTISEYTTGSNNRSTVQRQLCVAENRLGWYLRDVFPEPPPDPDSKISVPRSVVIAEDGTTWTTAWLACGMYGTVVGVPFDSTIIAAGRSTTFYPNTEIEQFIERSS